MGLFLARDHYVARTRIQDCRVSPWTGDTSALMEIAVLRYLRRQNAKQLFQSCSDSVLLARTKIDTACPGIQRYAARLSSCCRSAQRAHELRNDLMHREPRESASL